MSIVIRDVYESELDAILALNNGAGMAVLPLQAQALRFLYCNASYFRVAERSGRLLGFLVGFSHMREHTSCNFAWFRQRYSHFFYIDRIVIASDMRGTGLGRLLYADVQNYAELRYPLLACEVFRDHGGDRALLFHGSFGFREVGQHVMAENSVRARMLMKDMCSYQWVHDTYKGCLPDVPWVGRERQAHCLA